jgi:hypothetical protein
VTAARGYAAGTSVPAERTRAEIERTLTAHGAVSVLIGSDSERRVAVVAFSAFGRQVRLFLPLPDPAEFKTTPKNQRRRSTVGAVAVAAAEERRRWRALLLMVKAKVEAVESGIITFDEEWLPHFVLPDGRTVAEHAVPAVETAYQTGTVGPLFPGHRPAIEG